MSKEIFVISSNPKGQVAARFREELVKRHITPNILDVRDIGSDHNGIPSGSVALMRVSPESNEACLKAARLLESNGIISINSSSSIEVARDKTKAFACMLRNNLAVPKTIILQGEETYKTLSTELGPRYVLKISNGTAGQGVELIDSESAMELFLKQWPQTKLLAQEFVDEANGQDSRIFVVGDKVVAAMNRMSKTGDFRSNIHAGGSGQSITIDASTRELALSCMRAMGLEIAGVDIIQSRRGPLILEANPSPGLQIESICGVNVAGQVIDYMTNKP